MPIDRQRNQTLFRRLSRLLQRAAEKPQAETVHQLRTVTRRVEVLLQALNPDADRNQQRLVKKLERLRRRAGRVRDIDVQLDLLHRLEIGRDGRQKQHLTRVLADLRGQREKKLASVLQPGSRRVVLRRLGKAARKLNLFQEPAPRTGTEDAARPFDPVRTALREFTRIAREQGELREANLHAYRLETKQVRYVAEMAGKDQTAQRIVAELKRMQDAIGEWHDWLVLTRRAEKALEPARESPLMAALRNVTRAKFRDALRVCTEARQDLLGMAPAKLPPRKAAAGGGPGRVAANA